MRHFLSSSILLLVILSACQKVSSPSVFSRPTRPVEATFTVKGSMGENASVNSLTVLVFRKETGLIETIADIDGSSIVLDVIKGEAINFYIFANIHKESFSDVVKESDLSAKLSLLPDNAGGMVMMGKGSGTFTEASSVTVNLRRFANRVVLEKIIPSFATQYVVEDGLTIDAIYLINVYGSCSYTGESIGDVWYNKMSWDNSVVSPLKEMLRYDINHTVTDSTAFVLPESHNKLYFYTNEFDNDINSENHPSWSERNTRLVVETTLGGKKYYYPVTIPKLKGNDSYHIIELRLLGLGSDHPDIPVGRMGISFNISLEPWMQNNEDITLL